MKKFLESWMSTREEFISTERCVENSFESFLKNVPGWNDIIGSVIISESSEVPDDVENIGDSLIPSVKNIFYSKETDKISFDIKIIPTSLVPRYVRVDFFPLEWLTSPETAEIDYDYLKRKLERRNKYLEDLRKDRDSLDDRIQHYTKEVERIKKLLGEE